MKKISLFCCCLIAISCYRETALPLSPVVSTQVTLDNIDVMPNGVEATGIIGDYSLFNNQVQIVVQGNTWNPNYSIYEPLTGGSIKDASTRTTGQSLEQISKNDDGIYIFRQGVNLNSKTVIGYHSISVVQTNQEEASLVMKGKVFDLDHSLEEMGAMVSSVDRSVSDVEVETEIRLLASRETEVTTNAPVNFFKMTTVLSNTGNQSVPIHTVHDSILVGENVYDTFIPYPRWGLYKPDSSMNLSSTGMAYPPYVLLQSRQDGTNNLFFTPQLDGLFSANRETEPGAERIMFGKFYSGTEPLDGGGQMTYIREFHLNVKDTPAQTLYGLLVNFLQESMPASSIFQATGNLGYIADFKNAPGGEFTAEHVSSELQWFNGSSFQSASKETPFPVWGSRRLSNAFTFEVPVGTYQVKLQAFQGELNIADSVASTYVNEFGEELDVDSAPVVESDKTTSMGTIETGNGHASVTISGHDESGGNMLYRYSVVPQGDDPHPVLGPTPSNRAGNTLYSDKFKSTMVIPGGNYEMLISHGPLYYINTVEEFVEQTTHVNEFGIESERFVSSNSIVDATVGRSIDFLNYFSADFGLATALHENGLDNPASTMTYAECEDLDVVFFLDSHRINDANAFLLGQSAIIGNFVEADGDIQKQDLQDHIVSALAYSTRSIATESFPFGKGQFGVLNIAKDEVVDSPPLLFLDPASFYDEVRTAFPNSLILLQTPRAELEKNRALFSAISAMLGLADGESLPADNEYFHRQSGSGSSTTWLDFDLIQLLEGNNYASYLKARGDWFELLNAGIFKPATGGSMVGSTENLGVGSVRTYVAITNNEHRDNDLSEFWSSVRAGNMFVSNGPLIEASIGGSTYGQTTSGSPQTVMNLKVQASPWIPLASIRIFVDGQMVQKLQPLGTENIRFENEVALNLSSGRHWVVIEAGTELESFIPGTMMGTFGKVYRNHAPFAVTNPIFVNVGN